MGIKSIVFDTYGTLISTGTGSIDACKKILDDLCFKTVEPKTFYQQWKVLHREHIDGVTEFVSEKEIFLKDLEALFKRYDISKDPSNYIHHMYQSLYGRTPYTDVYASLLSLSNRYSLFIGSTSDHEPLVRDLEPFTQFFKKIYSSEILKAYKPKACFYKKIMSENNLRPSECLFVGDSVIDDVKGPIACGMEAVFLNRKGIKQDSYPEIASLSELNSHIDSELLL